MKRLTCAIGIIVLVGLVVYADLGEIEPLPEPIAIQITDMQPVEQWDLTKAYYRHVKLPDGSKVELKSKIVLTDKQWLQKADEIYKGKLEFEKMPETCPFCGRPME